MEGVDQFRFPGRYDLGRKHDVSPCCAQVVHTWDTARENGFVLDQGLEGHIRAIFGKVKMKTVISDGSRKCVFEIRFYGGPATIYIYY